MRPPGRPERLLLTAFDDGAGVLGLQRGPLPRHGGRGCRGNRAHCSPGSKGDSAGRLCKAVLWPGAHSGHIGCCGWSQALGAAATGGTSLWGCLGVGVIGCCPVTDSRCPVPLSLQYIDAIGSKQGELESYVSEGYKTALTEERRRFCFLVEKQCAVAKNSAAYHSKVGPLVRGPGHRGPHKCWSPGLSSFSGRGFWKEMDQVTACRCLSEPAGALGEVSLTACEESRLGAGSSGIALPGTPQ